MVIGLVYVYIGLTVFLMGVNVGFMPVGSFLGGSIASHEYNWILIPIAMVIGYFIVQAEPAVHVLNKQVEEITAGSIPAHAMNTALSIGVALSLGLAMIRVLTGISIMWFLIPGYAISLALSFVVPHIFTSVAFDSGGVGSGPLTVTFLRRRGRQSGDGCLRRGGDGGHDAAGDHPAAGSELPAQAAPRTRSCRACGGGGAYRAVLRRCLYV